MVEFEKPEFDAAAFLASAGLGRRVIQLAAEAAFFSQGDPADSIFYLQNGRARVTVVSAAEKEATIALLAAVFLPMLQHLSCSPLSCRNWPPRKPALRRHTRKTRRTTPMISGTGSSTP